MSWYMDLKDMVKSSIWFLTDMVFHKISLCLTIVLMALHLFDFTFNTYYVGERVLRAMAILVWICGVAQLILKSFYLMFSTYRPVENLCALNDFVVILGRAFSPLGGDLTTILGLYLALACNSTISEGYFNEKTFLNSMIMYQVGCTGFVTELYSNEVFFRFLLFAVCSRLYFTNMEIFKQFLHAAAWYSQFSVGIVMFSISFAMIISTCVTLHLQRDD